MTPSSLDSTVALTTSAIRVEAGVASADELARLLPTEAWARTIKWVAKLGFGPLLHAALVRSGLSDRVPDHQRERLRRLALGSAAAEAVRMGSLRGVLAILEPAGFEVFAIKGAALSVLMPEHALLRRSGDIDLWVPGRAATDANRVLQQAGYPLRFTQVPEDPRKWHCQPVMSPEDVMIEVHRRPWVQPLAGEDGPSPHTSIEHEFLDRPALIPSREDLIVIVAAHASVGRVTPDYLVALWDIGALARQSEIDWAQVGELARRIGCLRGVRAVLSRVAMLELADVPAELRLSPKRERDARITTAGQFEGGSALRDIWRRRHALDGLGVWLRSAWSALPQAPPLDRRLPGLVARRVTRLARELIRQTSPKDYETAEGER